MAMPDYESVPAYLAAQPPDVRRVLTQVRAAIRKAIPQARETISYKIPTYEVGGKPVVYFAAWKRHYSIYPISAGVQRALQTVLAGCDVEKGTVRFAFDAPVPGALIARIAKLRAAELPPPKASAKAKVKTKAKPQVKSRPRSH
jgi:uncharacterized protein YdhG (YjbR/CyaY superfamily)